MSEMSELSNEHGDPLTYDPSTATLSRRDGRSYLPSQPWISLSNDELVPFIAKSHKISDEKTRGDLLYLNHLTPKPIIPLHALVLSILPTDTSSAGLALLTPATVIATVTHPDLHLTHTNDPPRLYLKPVPRYLLSRAFWAWLRGSGSADGSASPAPAPAGMAVVDPDARRAAEAHLRSYGALLRDDVDFRLAVRPDVALLPADGADGRQPLTLDAFVELLRDLGLDKPAVAAAAAPAEGGGGGSSSSDGANEEGDGEEEKEDDVEKGEEAEGAKAEEGGGEGESQWTDPWAKHVMQLRSNKKISALYAPADKTHNKDEAMVGVLFTCLFGWLVAQFFIYRGVGSLKLPALHVIMRLVGSILALFFVYLSICFAYEGCKKYKARREKKTAWKDGVQYEAAGGEEQV